jgi:hypothetical protein
MNEWAMATHIDVSTTDVADRGSEPRHVQYTERLNFVYSQSQSQSQSYFTTDGLQPISSSWRQAPWASRPAFLLT